MPGVIRISGCFRSCSSDHASVRFKTRVVHRSCYAIAESATTAATVKPPNIGSNVRMMSCASFFFSIEVMIRFLTCQ